MRLLIASKNPVKIEAVQEVIALYPEFCELAYESFETPSGVSNQPMSLEETVRGALNRARSIHQPGDLSFGIESGIMDVPYTKTGVLDVCVCAIWDGNQPAIGLSCAWECPEAVADAVKRGMNLADAAVHAGLTSNPKLGAAEGLIGIMTRGRMTRKDYTKQAVITAMIHVEK